MVRNVLLAAAALSLFLGTAVGAAPCRDAKTHKFIKCPPPAAAAATVATKTTATKVTKTKTKTKTKTTTKRCRNAKGQFAKCGTPGAKPA